MLVLCRILYFIFCDVLCLLVGREKKQKKLEVCVISCYNHTDIFIWPTWRVTVTNADTEFYPK